MELTKYLEKSSQTSFAELLGVSQGAVWQWASGKTPPSPEKALAIERATNGEVTRRELRPDDFWRIWPDLANLAPTESTVA
jgi:DNA-binding transcriptional regulator YdaS (Cro superfamily)